MSKKEQIQLRNREKHLQKQHAEAYCQVMDKTRNYFFGDYFNPVFRKAGLCMFLPNTRNAVEDCRCCFLFLFLIGTTCVCILPKASPTIGQKEYQQKELSWGEKPTDTSSIMKRQKAVAHAQANTESCACMFGEVKEGTWHGAVESKGLCMCDCSRNYH